MVYAHDISHALSLREPQCLCVIMKKIILCILLCLPVIVFAAPLHGEPPLSVVSPKDITINNVSGRIESGGDEETTNPYTSCVKVARMYGLQLPPGDAQDLIPNDIPTVGGGILFSYTNNDHVAVIKEFREDGYWIVEGNFSTTTKATYRLVAYNDPFIKGFWTRTAYDKSIQQSGTLSGE